MNYVIKLGLFGALKSYVKYNIKKDWKLLKNKLVSSWSYIDKKIWIKLFKNLIFKLKLQSRKTLYNSFETSDLIQDCLTLNFQVSTGFD